MSSYKRNNSIVDAVFSVLSVYQQSVCSVYCYHLVSAVVLLLIEYSSICFFFVWFLSIGNVWIAIHIPGQIHCCLMYAGFTLVWLNLSMTTLYGCNFSILDSLAQTCCRCWWLLVAVDIFYLFFYTLYTFQYMLILSI